MSHETQAELSACLAKASESVTVGAHYVHYKQPEHQYVVVALALREEDNEPCVVYKAEYGDHITFIRPVVSWLEEIEVNGKMLKRFTKTS